MIDYPRSYLFSWKVLYGTMPFFEGFPLPPSILQVERIFLQRDAFSKITPIRFDPVPILIPSQNRAL